MLTVRARRLFVLLAALTTLILTGCAGIATASTLHSLAAQDRVGAFNPAAPTLTRPAAPRSPCSRPGSVLSAAGSASGFCVAAEDGSGVLARLADETGAINFGKLAARKTLSGLDITSEQLVAANRAIGRATASTDIGVRTEGANVVVRLSRPGAIGSQVIESVITPTGEKSVVQLAYDQAGNLVHYDPKTP